MSFPANSRYAGFETLRLVRRDGTEIAYLQRRFVPDPAAFVELGEHVVAEGDRLDNIAALTLGDPELAWRLADANRALRPAELAETIGRRLRITLPAAIGTTPRA